MPRGGARPNTGPKKGSTFSTIAVTPTTKKVVSDALMEKVKNIKVTPMEVMLIGMKAHFDDAQEAMMLSTTLQDGDAKEHSKRVAKAELAASMAYAEKVAPYIHAKLQTTTIKGDKESPLEVALGLASIDDLRKAIRGK